MGYQSDTHADWTAVILKVGYALSGHIHGKRSFAERAWTSLRQEFLKMIRTEFLRHGSLSAEPLRTAFKTTVILHQ